MRILLLSHYKLYENIPRSFRTLELLKKMQEYGYEVDLLVGIEKRLYKNYKIETELKKSCDKVSNKKKKFATIRKLISSILNYLFGDMVILKYYHANKRLIRDKNYDVVLSIGQPFYVHMISAKIKCEDRTIKVADCGDPFYIKGKHMAPYIGNLQRKIFAKMDYVTVPTEKAVPYYVDYVKRSKIKVIPQGVDFNSFDIAKYVKNPVPTFGYAGVFYEKLRDPTIFIEQLMKLDKEYKLILYTDTRNKFFVEKIIPLLQQCGDKVQINGIIERKECIYELSKMDFVLNFENESAIQSPSKLIDYALTKRPVLSIKMSEYKEELLEEFLVGNFDKQMVYDISEYDIEKVFQKFDILFKDTKNHILEVL